MQKPPTTYIRSPNQNDRPAVMKTPDAIVLHHTAGTGTAESVARYFADPASKVSAHYVVDKAGTIVQCVSDGCRAWHAGESAMDGRKDVNDFSIGIELINKGDGKDPYTADQYWALADLVAWLMAAYHIRINRIVGHRDVALPKGRKTDPSDSFDWPRLRRLLTSKAKTEPPGKPPTPAA